MPAPGSWAPRDLVVNGARPSDEMARFLRDNTANMSACLACLSETEKMIALVSTTLTQIHGQVPGEAVLSAPPSLSRPNSIDEPARESTDVPAGESGQREDQEKIVVTNGAGHENGIVANGESGGPKTAPSAEMEKKPTAEDAADLLQCVANANEEQQENEPRSSLMTCEEHHEHVQKRLFGAAGKKFEYQGTLMCKLRHMTHSPAFEVTFIMVIVANAMVMAMEQQVVGEKLGDQIRAQTNETDQGFVPRPRSEIDGGGRIFEILEAIFCLLFAVELILKVVAWGSHFFKEVWNYIDLFVVTVGVLELFLASVIPIKSGIIRVVRLIRLGRLMRLVRTLEGFDQLFLMVTAIKGSASVLGWALILLVTIQLALALAMTQVLQVIYFEDESKPNASEQIMWNYFGTFSRAMLSLFEMTMGNWVPICRLLVEDVNEWFMFANLAHKFTIGFAVIGVVNGVFMRETFKVAETDDNIMMRSKKNAMKLHRKKMERLFHSMDIDDNGKISLEEFKLIADVPQVKTWLGSMDLRTDDIPLLFDLIDENKNGEINLDEMIAGIGKLKGAARSIDMAAAINHIREL